MRTEARIRAAFKATLGQFVLDAAFELPSRGVIGVFGPSGCGKTSLLRCIAGLLRVPDGYFSIGDERWQDGAAFRPPHERAIGYVFQEPSLFAHLSVRNNLRFGMPRGRTRASAGSAGVSWDDVVALLGMEDWLERSPRHLSGGERQRVAIGRALLSEPRLLLLDEPLSALDQRAKGEILPLLERLHRALSIPVLYVSHDMTELERFADQLVLMDAGRVVAAGPLPTLACDPDLPLLRARDAAVSLEALVEDYDSAYGLLALRVGGARFLVPAAPCSAGERRRLRVRAEDVSLALERPTGSSIINVLPARILSVSGLGTNEITLVLGLDGAQGQEDPVDGSGTRARLLSRVTRRSWEQLQLAEGRAVFAQVKSVALAPQPPR